MFDRYSVRAMRVLFLARMKAGRQGAATIETKHLLEALVLEDHQGELDKLLPGGRWSGIESAIGPKRAFFSTDEAAAILSGLKGSSVSAAAISNSVDMSLGEEAKVILSSALELADELRDSEVQPLHLLAATLAKGTGDETRVLASAGVSRDRVLAVIRSGEFL